MFLGMHKFEYNFCSLLSSATAILLQCKICKHIFDGNNLKIKSNLLLRKYRFNPSFTCNGEGPKVPEEAAATGVRLFYCFG